MNSAASPQSADAPPLAKILYDGFISYRHDDKQITIAHALQRALHGFAKPWYWLRAVRLYRDETNLSARPDLWKAIEAALDASRFLILMASPEAASSHWVEQEMAHWLRTKGRDSVIIVLTQGTIAWDDAGQRFDPAKTTALPASALAGATSEPFWIDLTWVTDAAHELRIEHPRFRDAIASIAATLRQVDKDAIIGEDLRLRRRALRLAWAAATGLAVLAGASLAGGATAIRQAEEARREQVRATQWADRRLFTITLILARQVEGDRTFSSVSYDNFQGLDFGMYLGWDQRTGRLQRLLAAMYAADQPLFEQVLADGDAELARALLAIPREPSRDGQGDARFDLGSQTWQDRFRRAGELVPFQRVQLDEALRDFSANLAAVQTQMPELRTERAIAFMVDVMTQHGRGAATRFYQQARAGHTEEAILDKVSELSVAQAKRALPQAARAFERRRQLFRTTPFLLDVTVSGTDLPRPSWREDILDWSQRMAKGILAPVRPTGATQK